MQKAHIVFPSTGSQLSVFGAHLQPSVSRSVHIFTKNQNLTSDFTKPIQQPWGLEKRTKRNESHFSVQECPSQNMFCKEM